MYQKHPQQHISFLNLIWRFKFHLALYIVVISCLTYVALYLLGGVPEEFKASDSTPDNVVQAQVVKVQPKIRPGGVENFVVNSPLITSRTSVVQGDLPTRIIIDKIGVNIAVRNPASSSTQVLDDELLRGAVRYPGSGTIGHGNMFLFGHSTGIKIVNNQAYKAFNHLKDLKAGDSIKVLSGTKVYLYKVNTVKLADSDKVVVDIASTKNMLTLSTCNVFGEKQERFIVEATFVGAQ